MVKWCRKPWPSPHLALQKQNCTQHRQTENTKEMLLTTLTKPLQQAEQANASFTLVFNVYFKRNQVYIFKGTENISLAFSLLLKMLKPGHKAQKMSIVTLLKRNSEL